MIGSHRRESISRQGSHRRFRIVGLLVGVGLLLGLALWWIPPSEAPSESRKLERLVHRVILLLPPGALTDFRRYDDREVLYRRFGRVRPQSRELQGPISSSASRDRSRPVVHSHAAQQCNKQYPW